ncbi:hypothetical protein [Stieleria varia]|uniref:Uncharacterized protein n=1 Tax=Stieleria varia TaxID=2528005 RepID=A0A5C6ATS6_9BACT|nr:hypothetical protein [Stieleria varia]TWU02988.1 hypothetical protein Pla52n_40770 [Stieleria varia]
MSQQKTCVSHGLLVWQATLAFTAGVLAIVSSGCGSDRPSMEELDVWIRTHHRSGEVNQTLNSISLVNSNKQSDSSLKLEFQVHEQLKCDTFHPESLAEAFAAYNHDPSSFERARQTLAGLREPERSVAKTRMPPPEPPLQIFRRTGSTGDKSTSNGSVIARKNASKWEFTDLDIQVVAKGFGADAIARNDLPNDAVLLEPNVSENSVTRLIAKRNELIQAVANAEVQMKERLNREHQQLLAMIHSNQSFQASIFATNGPVQQLSLQFVHQESDGEKVVVLLEDVADHLRRASWIGSLKLADPPQPTSNENGMPDGVRPQPDGVRPQPDGVRPQPDGWSISLTPVEGEPPFPKTDAQSNITLGILSDNQLAWFKSQSPVAFQNTAISSPLPDYRAYRSQIQQWTGRGRVWEGAIQYDGDVSRNVRLTFAENRDEGKYVRVIMETSVDDFAVAIFEGVLTTSPENIFSWPLNLKWTSGEGTKFQGTEHQLPMITSGIGGSLRLAFSPTGECFGASSSRGSLTQNISVDLKPAAEVAEMQSSLSRWETALQSGTRWTGKIVRGESAADKVVLNVCEVHDDGQAFQMTIQNPDNPHQFRSFSATLDPMDRAIDGYALLLEAKSSVAQPTHFGYSGYADVYGVHRDAKHQFRLSTDGTTLLGISGSKELIELTREETSIKAPSDRDGMAQSWQQACATGNRWKGRLTNSRMESSTDIEMKVTSGVDATGTVEVELSIPRQRTPGSRFRGQLRLDGDNVHGFAIVLQKHEQNRGAGESLVFGSSQQGIELLFRLAEDGTGLIGMASEAGQAIEFLELQRIPATQSRLNR